MVCFIYSRLKQKIQTAMRNETEEIVQELNEMQEEEEEQGELNTEQILHIMQEEAERQDDWNRMQILRVIQTLNTVREPRRILNIVQEERRVLNITTESNGRFYNINQIVALFRTLINNQMFVDVLGILMYPILPILIDSFIGEYLPNDLKTLIYYTMFISCIYKSFSFISSY